MIPRGRALACLVAAMAIASRSHAGVWTTDPVLGLSAEFSTNPGLLTAPHPAETHGAVLIDLPTVYHADDVSLTVKPSFRLSDSAGYSSLASDYEHVTFIGKLDGERDTVAATVQAARDSSLYYDYGFNGSTGVQRDTLLADVTWTRTLTERLSANLDTTATRVDYAQPSGLNILTNYHYSSAAPALSWKAGERTSLTLVGNVGLYGSADGSTKSTNTSLELGFMRQLDELWSVTANGGYSRESNKISEYYGPFLLASLKSTTTGSVFTANVTRQGALMTLSAQASRSLVPSGFAFLSEQDSYQLSLDYPSTERWTFSGHTRWLTSREPQVAGPTTEQSYWDLGVSATWLFTEHWTVIMRASHVSARYAPPVVNVGASGVSIELARHFDTIVWH
jgi:hypothetical protein